MSDGQQVLILGGGLAGLSFAIALATEAPAPIVVERPGANAHCGATTCTLDKFDAS